MVEVSQKHQFAQFSSSGQIPVKYQFLEYFNFLKHNMKFRLALVLMLAAIKAAEGSQDSYEYWNEDNLISHRVGQTPNRRIFFDGNFPAGLAGGSAAAVAVSTSAQSFSNFIFTNFGVIHFCNAAWWGFPQQGFRMYSLSNYLGFFLILCFY